ncbi:MAG: M67 family metallopeptidase, partial [Terriglobia bacterium]
ERNRFLIDPDDLRRAEKDARGRGIETVGFYHSHPDHPARPSEYDRDHAFPWYSYVIIAVEAGKAGRYTSWVLRDDRTQFDEERLEVVERRAPAAIEGDQ